MGKTTEFSRVRSYTKSPDRSQVGHDADEDFLGGVCSVFGRIEHPLGQAVDEALVASDKLFLRASLPLDGRVYQGRIGAVAIVGGGERSCHDWVTHACLEGLFKPSVTDAGLPRRSCAHGSPSALQHRREIAATSRRAVSLSTAP